MSIPRERENEVWNAAPAGLLRWDAQSRTRGARESVVHAAGACAAADVRGRILDDATRRNVQDTDQAFQHLHECVRQYASKLRFLGYSARSATGMVLSAIRESVSDGNPDPVILSAAEDWALEPSHTIAGDG